MFRVKGTSALSADIDIVVTVNGNDSVTLTQLPIGDYTVTELTEWSYRYTPDSESKQIELSVVASENKISFSHTRTNTKWLDGNDNNVNKYN